MSDGLRGTPSVCVCAVFVCVCWLRLETQDSTVTRLGGTLSKPAGNVSSCCHQGVQRHPGHRPQDSHPLGPYVDPDAMKRTGKTTNL